MEFLAPEILANFGIAGFALALMAYMMIKNAESRERNTDSFLNAIKEQREGFEVTLTELRTQHEARMQERETAFRSLEREVRDRIVPLLTESSRVTQENIRTLERVNSSLDK